MNILYQTTVRKKQWQQIQHLLTKYNDAFVPPLNIRTGTCQSNFRNKTATVPGGYLAKLQKQSFLPGYDDQQLAGFVSFKEDYIPFLLAGYAPSKATGLYVTTILTDGAYRRHGLAKALYKNLIILHPLQSRLISTRTWSGNAAHISLLEKLNFDGPLMLANDRGPGLHTVYYWKHIQP